MHKILQSPLEVYSLFKDAKHLFLHEDTNRQSERGYLSTLKTNIIWYCLYVDPKMTSSATWMDLEMIILNKVSQTEKDKYMILLIFEI